MNERCRSCGLVIGLEYGELSDFSDRVVSASRESLEEHQCKFCFLKEKHDVGVVKEK